MNHDHDTNPGGWTPPPPGTWSSGSLRDPGAFDASPVTYGTYSRAEDRARRRRRLSRWLGALALLVGLVASTYTPAGVLDRPNWPADLLRGPEDLLGRLGVPTGGLDVVLRPFGSIPQAQAQTDPATEEALKQLIQHANDEQVQAIASRDPSVMADSVTAQHYQELVQINQDLLDSGVTRIELLNLSWGAIGVDGTTARVTTTETWRATFADGSNDQSEDRNDYTLVLDNGAWKISADEHPGDVPGPGVAPAPPQPLPPGPGRPGGPGTSRNWSGYAASGGTFTGVTGTWTVPDALSGGGGPGADAAWVGIGGVRSQDLIQAGTQEAVSGTGRVHYEAWIEMLPRPSRPVQLAVHPGDEVRVSIEEQAPDEWLIDFVNNTTGATYQQTVNYPSSHSSAEWVEEAPSAGRRILPLANFGSIAFSNASAVRDGQRQSIADLKGRAITMIDRAGQALATPSPLGDDGGSFSIARTGTAAADTNPSTGGFGFFPNPGAGGGRRVQRGP
jgi:Peptidase A4 family